MMVLHSEMDFATPDNPADLIVFLIITKTRKTVDYCYRDFISYSSLLNMTLSIMVYVNY